MYRPFLALVLINLFAVLTFSQTTEFNYQGNLKDGANPANANYDIEFRLFAADAGGVALGTLQRLNVPVANGAFSVKLDFGAQFPGANRWLEIAVRLAGGGSFTTLTPRQQISNAPYSVRSLNAANADNATNAINATTSTNALQLGGVAANQYVLTTDSRMSDARAPLPNSSNYIQNGTAQQAAADFNISGNGTVGGTLKGNAVNAISQFEINGLRAFRMNINTLSLYGGYTSGAGPTGDNNTFFGMDMAGSANTGSRNSFFGAVAGHANVAGSRNSYFGVGAGESNVSGNENSFFGSGSGGFSTGGRNTFLGFRSGVTNAAGSDNTTLGANSDVASPGLSFATAVGAGSVVSTSNTIALGRSNGSDTVQVPGSLNVSGAITGTASNALNLGGVAANQYVVTTDPRMTDARPPTAGSANYIQNSLVYQSANFNISGTGTVGGTLSGGVVNATTQYNIDGNRVLANANASLFVGEGAGPATTVEPGNSLFGYYAGANIQTGGYNSFFGEFAGTFHLSGGFNAFFGQKAGYLSQSGTGNSFFGNEAGLQALGSGNSYVGSSTGRFSSGDFNSFVGHRAGEVNTGNLNSFFGTGAGFINRAGSSNTFVGHDAGNTNEAGSFNTVLGENSDVAPGDLTNATAIGSKALVSQSNSLVLGSINGVNSATADTNVGIGTTAPQTKLHVSGAGAVRVRVNSSGNTGVSLTLNEQPGWSLATVSPGQFQIFNDAIAQNAVWIDPANNNVGIGTVSSAAKLDVGGTLRIGTLGSAGGTSLCLNASQIVAACSSSARYKSNIVSFNRGLAEIRRLRPVAFTWTQGGMRDFGLVAEEVSEVEPLLVSHNDKGEIEGVKYDRVSVVLVNAVKEQQAEIESQRRMIEAQQKQIDALTKLVCAANPSAEICGKP